MGFPDGASSKEPVCQCRRQETRVQSLGWKDPLEDDSISLQYSSLGEPHGQRSLVGYSP